MPACVGAGRVGVGEEDIEPDERRELGRNYQPGSNDYAGHEQQRAGPVIRPRADLK